MQVLLTRLQVLGIRVLFYERAVPSEEAARRRARGYGPTGIVTCAAGLDTPALISTALRGIVPLAPAVNVIWFVWLGAVPTSSPLAPPGLVNAAFEMVHRYVIPARAGTDATFPRELAGTLVGAVIVSAGNAVYVLMTGTGLAERAVLSVTLSSETR